MLIIDIKRYNLEDNFKNFMYSFFNVEEKEVRTNKSPFELLKSVGYTLYKCNSEEEIQAFKKYYADGEKLCTFNGDRLKRCYVFFAVKNNAEKLNREDFTNPQREDDYGTSVISIQFSKGKINTLSIKNRYNHSVNNPDATFSNNLDNIVEGLTCAFEKKYGLNINQNADDYSNFLTEKLTYVKAKDGKYYRYNMEFDNIYYCENNVIIDSGNVIDDYIYEKERYILMDYFILDLKQKRIIVHDLYIRDSLLNHINSIVNRIDIKKEGNNKRIIIKTNAQYDITIVVDKNGNIIEYEDENIEELGTNFLMCNTKLNKISIPNVKIIGDNFLRSNTELTEIYLPNVTRIGNFFLKENKKIVTINIENVREIGNWGLYHNDGLLELNLPNAKKIGSGFMYYNRFLTNIELPVVEEIEGCFLYLNNSLKQISLPNVKKIRNEFLSSNEILSDVYLPNVISIGSKFLSDNTQLKSLSLPKVTKIGEDFLYKNIGIETVYLPKAKTIGNCFLFKNKKLSTISLPEVEHIEHSFLLSNHILRDVNMPKLSNLDIYDLLPFNIIARNKVIECYMDNHPELTRKQKRLFKKK